MLFYVIHSNTIVFEIDVASWINNMPYIWTPDVILLLLIILVLPIIAILRQ